MPKPGEKEIVKVQPDRVTDLAAPVDELERIQWVIDHIAAEGHQPIADGPWKGRAQTARYAQQELGIEKAEAEKLVDAAVADLCQGKESEKVVKVRLLKRRIAYYRQIFSRVVLSKDKGGEMVYAWVSVKDMDEHSPTFGKNKLTPEGAPILVKVPKREIKFTGFDAVAAKLLLELEQIEMKLERLDEEEADQDVLMSIFARLDQQDGEGKTTKTTVTSVAQKVKHANLANLGAAGRAILNEAIGRKKLIAARVGEVSDEDVKQS